MALAEQNVYTMEDIYNLPEGKRAEIIDGNIYFMAPPSRRHQEIVFNLSRKIADYIEQNAGECKVYISPFAVFLNKDNKNYVEPDISVICDKSKLTENGCDGAPDWIIEVVSPSSQRMDYMVKLFKYRTAGVCEYWIVDAAKNRVMVYNFEKDTLEEHTMSECINAGMYEDFYIDLSQI